ncbi:MAG: hypothetical protein U0K70_07495, partial [Acutalibacteraceae bacterium]|nr:hypothetical protein [Acutalibacteraceae bacterium]
MARKMADEILEAERGSERIISDAEKRAAEISDTAKLKAAEETARIFSEAEKNAEILLAEGEAEYMRILSEAYNDSAKADYLEEYLGTIHD